MLNTAWILQHTHTSPLPPSAFVLTTMMSDRILPKSFPQTCPSGALGIDI